MTKPKPRIVRIELNAAYQGLPLIAEATLIKRQGLREYDVYYRDRLVGEIVPWQDEPGWLGRPYVPNVKTWPESWMGTGSLAEVAEAVVSHALDQGL